MRHTYAWLFVTVVSVIHIVSGEATAQNKAAPTASSKVQHPRLLVTNERIEQIRKQIKIDGSSHQIAYKAMKARVDRNNPAKVYFGSAKYAPGYHAREAAFLCMLAEDPAERRKYADMACKSLMGGSQGSGTLGRSMYSRNLGLAYDWAYNAWTEEQRAGIEKHVQQCLAALKQIRHSNLGEDRSSNFVGVIRGAEMILLLASGAGPNDERYRFLKKELARHIKQGFGSLGLCKEGMGYAEYPGEFLYPAIYACESVGDTELLTLARTKGFCKLVMYVDSFMDITRKFIQYGVAHTSNHNAGYASAMLHLCSKEQLPYLQFWYDRHMGKHSRSGGDQAFDGQRAGATLAMLYYPETSKAKDPTGVYPKGVEDDLGYHFFRNRWKDENDIMVSIASDAHHHKRGWSQHEKFAINIMAYDTRFIGGPGKTRTPNVYSALLVDGVYVKKGTKRDVDGERIDFRVTDNGGYAIAGGGAFYKRLGLTDAARHMLVHFSAPNKNTAIISTLDDLKSTTEHQYTWQANIGAEMAHDWPTTLNPPLEPLKTDDGVKVTTGNESGRPIFTLTGRNGWIKGWVLHPADATVKAGDPLQINTKGSNARIWVVMHVGAGDIPTANISGKGMETRLTVADCTIGFDGKKIVRK